jgi:hypothetical protein
LDVVEAEERSELVDPTSPSQRGLFFAAAFGVAGVILVLGWAANTLPQMADVPESLSIVSYFMVILFFVMAGGFVLLATVSKLRRIPWGVRAVQRGMEVQIVLEGTVVVPWEDIVSVSTPERRVFYRTRDGKGTENFVLLSSKQFEAVMQNQYFPGRLRNG